MSTTPTEAAHDRCAPTEDGHSVVLHVPMSYRPALEAIAAARGVSVSAVVRDALVAYLGSEVVK